MDAQTSLEARVDSLERSLRRSRRAVAALGLAVLIAVASAFAQATPTEQAQEQVATQRLALTDEMGGALVVRRGGTDGSLVVATPDGREVVRLGGPAARRIGH